MSILHKRLIRYLRALKVPLPSATGCRHKDSAVKNVMRHNQNRYFYLLDILNAFPSVNIELLTQILCKIDSRLTSQEKEVLSFLQKYCVSPQGGLVIGAPASPDLFNIYCGILIDPLLEYLCRGYSLTFTRYLDDFTFSSSKVPIGKRKRRAIRKTITAAGFSVNHRKSKVYDLKKGAIKINGVGLEFGGRIFLPRHYLRMIHGLSHRAITGEDIRPNKIHGMMGVFWPTIVDNNLNKTEQVLVAKYRAFVAWSKYGIEANRIL